MDALIRSIGHAGGGRRTRKSSRSHVLCAGFTLIELLVALAVISLLLAILLPALSAGRQAAQDLMCKTNLRNVSLSFMLFADGSNGNLGDSTSLGGQRFFIEDFQESIYQIDEFWSGDPEEIESQPLDGIATSMMCPSLASARLDRRAGFPCSAGAVGPQKNVSVGFNMRLHRRTQTIDGVNYLRLAQLTPAILQFPDVPLLFDVDGKAAVESGTIPYYSAPPLLDDSCADAYEDGAHWFPSLRHRNRINVAFIGGHVLSSPEPVREPWWKWGYQPPGS
ncbi:MAG: prepilin-type N-terminal cleavage/methylation domain-containing protein [Phycisphaerae bacterium]|nr:prepilin-type N-terminal cleavage/methylation domain-containing protein [Phycisphaerae bacterium]